MTRSLVLADSEIRRVVAEGDTLRIEFSAAAVRGPGGDPGWLTTVVATLAQATCAGDLAHAFGKVAEGVVQVDGARVNAPGVPARLDGAVVLTLRFANGTALSAQGAALILASAPDARFTEDLSC